MHNDICFPVPSFRDETIFIQSEMHCKWQISDGYLEIIQLIRKNASLVYEINNFYQTTEKNMYTKLKLASLPWAVKNVLPKIILRVFQIKSNFS